MSDPARRRLTYEDLVAAWRPDGPVPELMDGEIVYKAFPRARHGWSATRVLRQIGHLSDDDDDPQGWWLVIEPDVRLSPDRVVAPDLAGWRRSRLPDLPEEAAPIDVVPDWICEILSPGHERHDLVRKQTLYLEHRVAHYWIVNPELRILEAFEWLDARWSLLGKWSDGDRVRIPPFATVDFDVGRLFTPRR